MVDMVVIVCVLMDRLLDRLANGCFTCETVFWQVFVTKCAVVPYRVEFPTPPFLHSIEQSFPDGRN